jgi:AP-2 complex subunit mu-1
MEYRIQIRSQFHPQVFAQNVALKIPTPPTTSGCKVTCTSGKAKYVGAENAVIWKMQKFQGQTEHIVTVELELVSNPSQQVRWSRPPISMDFQVLMFTASGMLVRFLKIFERTSSGGEYPVVKWVRYMTRAGHYEIRF